MPSPNPTLTPNLHLPSPIPADPPDVPGDIKALADKLDDGFRVRSATATWTRPDWDNFTKVRYVEALGLVIIRVFFSRSNAVDLAANEPLGKWSGSVVPTPTEPVYSIAQHNAADKFVALQIADDGAGEWAIRVRHPVTQVSNIQGLTVYITP